MVSQYKLASLNVNFELADRSSLYIGTRLSY